MPTRAVTILCLLQVLALTGCYLCVNWLTRIAEKQPGWEAVINTSWGAWMSFVRNWILLILLAPIGVAVLCTKLSEVYRSVVLVGAGGVRLAFLATLVVALFSLNISAMALAGPPQHGMITRFKL
jgi:hypothetical protein